MRKKKTASRKKAAPKNGLVKRLAIKLGAAKKPAPKKLAVNKIPATLAAPAAVKHSPLHLPSRPEPAYSLMHRRDWARTPPPHKIPIPKR